MARRYAEKMKAVFHFCLGLAFMLALAAPAAAQDAGPAAPAPAPVDASSAREGRAEPGGLVFVMLFSAERCPFCPEAERNFSDILADPAIIGFTCMVDYFDTGLKGEISQKFCTAEQDLYIDRIKGSSRYTPQLVVNGRAQIPGNNLQMTAETLRAERAAARRVLDLDIRPAAADKAAAFDVVLPAMPDSQPAETATGEEKYALRLVKIQTLSAAQGERKPQNMATALVEEGLWDGKRTIWTVRPPENVAGDAFLVLVQDRRSGEIRAAGKHALGATQ